MIKAHITLIVRFMSSLMLLLIRPEVPVCSPEVGDPFLGKSQALTSDCDIVITRSAIPNGSNGAEIVPPTQFCDEKCAEGTEDGKETGQRLVVGVLGVVASWIMGIFFLSHFLFSKFSVMLLIMFIITK